MKEAVDEVNESYEKELDNIYSTLKTDREKEKFVNRLIVFQMKLERKY